MRTGNTKWKFNAGSSFTPFPESSGGRNEHGCAVSPHNVSDRRGHCNRGVANREMPGLCQVHLIVVNMPPCCAHAPNECQHGDVGRSMSAAHAAKVHEHAQRRYRSSRPELPSSLPTMTPKVTPSVDRSSFGRQPGPSGTSCLSGAAVLQRMTRAAVQTQKWSVRCPRGSRASLSLAPIRLAAAIDAATDGLLMSLPAARQAERDCECENKKNLRGNLARRWTPTYVVGAAQLGISV